MSEHSPAPSSDLDDLQALSRRLGADLTLVQGSGGNTSIKDGEVLWVKASGTWLFNAEEQEILVPVDLPRAEATLKAGGSDFNLPKFFKICSGLCLFLGISASLPSVEYPIFQLDTLEGGRSVAICEA